MFSSYALAVDAMLDGEGVALASRPLLPRMLGDGEIVPVSDRRLRTERAYYLAFRPDRHQSDQAQRLFRWLIESSGGHRLPRTT